MAGFLRVVRSLVLLLARIGLGGILILHGWRRWQEQGMDSQIAYLRTFATPFANYAAWGGTIIELVGGIFLIVGALVPLVAAVVVAEQVLIIAYTSWYKGWNLAEVNGGQATWNGGWEYNVILGLLALLLVVYGSGAVGVDRLFRRRTKDEGEDAQPEPEPRQRLERRTEPRPATPATSTGTGTPSTAPPSTRDRSTGPAPSENTTDTLIRPRG
ncbi:DoxX family protein [Microlunatus sp. Gsoil 973]|uniref:DoxX family protein n=1 Tax=Microlunatus sp. Gsoil 973 TaxID=2672569 RepID=UPI0018A7F020|nr:DoxX family protein [Microlunatus sp. Gsoil 973]